MRVCAFGSFDREFDRSWILLDALAQSGATITYCHLDLWARHRHKTGLFPWRWLFLAGKYFFGIVRISLQFLREPPCDVVYVGYMGQVDLLVAAFLNRRRRATLVFDPCISLYNTLIEDRQVIKAGGLIAKIVERLDMVPCRLADVVLIDTSAHGDYFSNVLDVPRQKIHRVFVGADPAWQRANWTAPSDDRFEVLFYAKFSPLHGVAAILDAVDRLKHERVHFTIVGGGQLEDIVREAVKRLPPSAIEWIPWLEREALVERMRVSHVNLGIFGKTTKAGMVIPNKVFQSLAMGVPTLTRDTRAIHELLEHGRSVELCGADGASIATAIKALRDDRRRLKAIGEGGRAAFVERASPKAIADQFLHAVHGR